MTTIQFNNGYAKVHTAHAHAYTEGEFPVMTYYTAESRWAPFSVERGADHRQITSISSEDAAAMVGAPDAFIRQVEAAAKKLISTQNGPTMLASRPAGVRGEA